jgi:hypothetical protein
MAIEDNFDYHPSNDPSQVGTGELHSIAWQKGGSSLSSGTVIVKERWTVMCRVYVNANIGSGCYAASGDSWLMNIGSLNTFTVLFTEMASFSPTGCAGPVCGGCTSNGSAQIMLYNESSTLQKTIPLMQDQNVIHSHEFQLIGSNVYHIRDGIISDLGAWTGSYIGYVKFYTYAYANTGYYNGSSTSIYVDNFATNSIIGISADRHPNAYTTHQILDNPLDHPNDEIDVTYQLAYSPPTSYISSEYKIKVRKLTGELINETVIKPIGQDATPLTPPFGIAKYSISALFGSNYGYYNFELTKGDVAISSDYVFYRYIPAAGSSTINVPDAGIAGSNINVDYTITPYQPSAYDYKIKIFNPSNVEIFVYNALQASGTTIFNTSSVPGTHNVILYSIDKITNQIYESAYDSITLTPSPIKGSISFTSFPTGALIYIDNVLQIEVTPATINNIVVGTHTYRLTLAGFNDYTGTASVLENHTTNVPIAQIVPNQGCIYFSTDVIGTSIYIDSVLQTGIITPAIICGLTLGSHTYGLELTGYRTITGNVVLGTGQGQTVTQTLVSCIPNWVCRQPLNGYEHDTNDCGQPDRLNPTCDIPLFCSWVLSKGGPTNIAVFDIMTLVSAYLGHADVGFPVTIAHIMGAVAYYLGNVLSGDSLTGCTFAP